MLSLLHIDAPISTGKSIGGPDLLPNSASSHLAMASSIPPSSSWPFSVL